MVIDSNLNFYGVEKLQNRERRYLERMSIKIMLSLILRWNFVVIYTDNTDNKEFYNSRVRIYTPVRNDYSNQNSLINLKSIYLPLMVQQFKSLYLVVYQSLES